MKAPGKEAIDGLTNIASLTQKAIAAAGIWILFCYCVSERIMPDDLTIGDALLLIMIALGFGVVIFLGIGYGIIAALAPVRLTISIYNLFNKDNKLSLISFLRDGTLIFVSTFIILVLALFALKNYGISNNDMRFIPTATCFVGIGFLLLLLFAVEHRGKVILSTKRRIALTLTAVLAPFSILHPAVMNITMSAFGIRSPPGAIVIIRAAEFPKLDELIKEVGFNVKFCPLPKSGDWATTDARVVWHGVGTTSFVEFHNNGLSDRSSILIPIPKAGVEVARPENWRVRCDKALLGQATSP